MVEISVIIPTHNRRQILNKCLKCLFDQDYPEDRYEIIVVDDGSTDGTREDINSLNPPCNLGYLYQARSGPHLARNRGLDAAEGEIILFIDSDIFAPPSLIREHMRFHARNDRIIVSGPLAETTNLDEDFRGIKKRKFLALFDLSGPSMITSNLSVRRKYLLQVGGFDEDFEGYGWHDWELGARLKKIGLCAKKSREALVYHLEEAKISSLEELGKKRFERGVNAALYLKKHPNLGTLLSIHPHFLILDRLIGLWSKKRNISLRWLLIQRYAEGLREGMRKQNLRTILKWM